MADNELGYIVEYLNFDDMVIDKFGIHKLYIISGTKKKKKKIMNSWLKRELIQAISFVTCYMNWQLKKMKNHSCLN